jgi:hypothetical protein
MIGRTGPTFASELLSTACVAPVVESYVSSENISEQGVRVEVELVSETFPWISPRLPVSPALVNGRVKVLNCSDSRVKDAGVPITPLALENEIVPVYRMAPVPVWGWLRRAPPPWPCSPP